LNVFVDTGPLIARYLKKDSMHEKSLAQWKALEKKGSKTAYKGICPE